MKFTQALSTAGSSTSS